MKWEQRRLLEMAGLLRRRTPDHLLTEGEDEGGDDAGGDAFLSPLELAHKIRLALSSEAETSTLAPAVLEQWIDMLGEMLSGSGDLTEGDANLNQEEILDLIDRIDDQRVRDIALYQDVSRFPLITETLVDEADPDCQV